EHEALAKELGAAKVTLQQGMTASEQEGQPISAKFEIENGKLQLSVYTSKSGKFSEVVVDYATGKVSKAEPITAGDDLTAAQTQSTAMAKAKSSLKAAVDKSRGEASGFRAVSVMPDMKDGRPGASVVLAKGSEFKTI